MWFSLGTVNLLDLVESTFDHRKSWVCFGRDQEFRCQGNSLRLTIVVSLSRIVRQDHIIFPYEIHARMSLSVRRSPSKSVFHASPYFDVHVRLIKPLQQYNTPTPKCQQTPSTHSHGPPEREGHSTHRHNETQQTNIRTQALSDPRRLPKDTERPIFVAVED